MRERNYLEKERFIKGEKCQIQHEEYMKTST